MKKLFIISSLLLLIPAFTFPAQDAVKNDSITGGQKLVINTSNQNLKLLILSDGSWQISKNDTHLCPEWKTGGAAVPGTPYSENGGTEYRINVMRADGIDLFLDVVNQDEEVMELKASTPQQMTAFKCYLNFETNRSRCIKTEGDMRILAATINGYYIDNDKYPGSGFENLLTTLEGSYLHSIPRVDGWGNPYIYETGSEDGSPDSSFRLISYGKDGKEGPVPPDGNIPLNDKDFFNYDIVITSDGITCKCCLLKQELLENEPLP
jgi:hypothetical protein